MRLAQRLRVGLGFSSVCVFALASNPKQKVDPCGPLKHYSPHGRQNPLLLEHLPRGRRTVPAKIDFITLIKFAQLPRHLAKSGAMTLALQSDKMLEIAGVFDALYTCLLHLVNRDPEC